MADRSPTVTATPTVPSSTMTACAPAFPFEPTFTARGLVAGSAEMPLRYWPGAVPAGTVTLKPSSSREWAGRVTRCGSPATQQLGPEHPRVIGSYALPLLVAVTPAARPMTSVSGLSARLNTVAVAVAD